MEETNRIRDQFSPKYSLLPQSFLNYPNYPNYQKKLDDEKSEEYTRILNVYLKKQKEDFSRWLEEVEKFNKNLREQIADGMKIEDGKLIITESRTLAEYLKYNSQAKLNLIAGTRQDAESKILEDYQVLKSLGLTDTFKNCISNIYFNENGVSKVLSGKEREDFVNNVIEKFEHGDKRGYKQVLEQDGQGYEQKSGAEKETRSNGRRPGWPPKLSSPGKR